MTTPKVRTVKIGEDRYYADEVAQDQVPGVTSIIGMRAKPALIGWAAKSAAEFAVDNLQTVVNLAEHNRIAAVDLVKRAHTRKAGEAATRGTNVHSIVERLLNGEKGVKVDKETRPFIEQFQRFANEYNLDVEYNEVTVWSTKHRYAGTIDGLWRLDGPNIAEPGKIAVCDIKTGASGVWEDVSFQLSAYKNADCMVFPDGSRKPMPETSTVGYALWLRPNGYALHPVDVGAETYATFLGLRRLFEWNKFRAKSAVGAPINPEPLKRGQ